MITQTQMYWITRLDPIVTLLAGMTMLMALVGITTTIVGVAMRFGSLDPDCKNIGRSMSKCGICALTLTSVLLAGKVLVPTTKEMAAILVVPKIANNEKLQYAGAKLYDLAIDWMEERCKSGKKDK